MPCGGLGARVLTWESGDYPPLLRQIDAPPPLLYVRGELLPTDEWAVAIVGTRHARYMAKRWPPLGRRPG